MNNQNIKFLIRFIGIISNIIDTSVNRGNVVSSEVEINNEYGNLYLIDRNLRIPKFSIGETAIIKLEATVFELTNLEIVKSNENNFIKQKVLENNNDLYIYANMKYKDKNDCIFSIGNNNDIFINDNIINSLNQSVSIGDVLIVKNPRLIILDVSWPRRVPGIDTYD